jgi:hypothetical protein
MLRKGIKFWQLIRRDKMVLNKTAVKRLFNDAGVQVNILALNNIDNWALSLVNDMVQRANKQGMKRLISRKISDVLPTIVVDEDD